MKRIMLSLVLLLAFGQIALAQDINKLMAELAKIEGVEHQIVDSEMLNASLAPALAADSTGELKSKMGFVSKLKFIEVVAAEDMAAEVKSKYEKELNDFKDGNGYETLLHVKDGSDNVRIMAYSQNGKTTEVIIFVVDEEDVTMVKMAGEFDESDLATIIEEQTKNK